MLFWLTNKFFSYIYRIFWISPSVCTLKFIAFTVNFGHVSHSICSFWTLYPKHSNHFDKFHLILISNLFRCSFTTVRNTVLSRSAGDLHWKTLEFCQRETKIFQQNSLRFCQSVTIDCVWLARYVFLCTIFVCSQYWNVYIDGI